MAGPILDREPMTEASTRAAASPARIEIRHGTALRWLDRGILLLGPSGAGKSDLALRLVDRGADLVADDLVRIEARAGRLIAMPQVAPGLIELRGQGIFRVPVLAETTLDLALQLGPADERLPANETVELAGQLLPVVHLDPTTASATARLRILLTGERVY